MLNKMNMGEDRQDHARIFRQSMEQEKAMARTNVMRIAPQPNNNHTTSTINMIDMTTTMATISLLKGIIRLHHHQRTTTTTTKAPNHTTTLLPRSNSSNQEEHRPATLLKSQHATHHQLTPANNPINPKRRPIQGSKRTKLSNLLRRRRASNTPESLGRLSMEVIGKYRTSCSLAIRKCHVVMEQVRSFRFFDTQLGIYFAYWDCMENIVLNIAKAFLSIL